MTSRCWMEKYHHGAAAVARTVVAHDGSGAHDGGYHKRGPEQRHYDAFSHSSFSCFNYGAVLLVVFCGDEEATTKGEWLMAYVLHSELVL
ncbi:hypothetical protein SESBI_47552 [Sesbania bispinosa]|nr:hypothetical protein SESBI_47552 [Sesbania bispinosa]